MTSKRIRNDSGSSEPERHDTLASERGCGQPVALPDFSFQCHRCGHCCRVGHGRVWLDEADISRLAAALELSREAFRERFVLEAEGRLSLRERANGRCVLLEGAAECTAYSARPAQCRDFPFWPEILDDGHALESAARYCPGIQILPSRDAQTALSDLANLYHELEHSDEAGEGVGADELLLCGPEQETARYASSLEVDFALEVAGEGIHDALGSRPGCPFRVDDRCGCPRARPLVCRLSNLTESSEKRDEQISHLRLSLERMAELRGYPWASSPWTRLIRERAQAWHAAGRWPSTRSTRMP